VPTSFAQPRGFSFGTKLTLLTVLIQLLFLGSVLFTSSRFLAERNFRESEKLLRTQVDLLAAEVTRQKDKGNNFDFSGLNLDRSFSFQVVSTQAVVVWDSKNPQRAQTQMVDQNMLYQLASKSPGARADTNFSVNAINFIGAFRKLPGDYTILGTSPFHATQLITEQILEKILFVALFFLGASMVLIALCTHQLVKPIRALTSAAQKIAGGNFDFELDPPSRDEIGNLSESFSSMMERVRELLKEEVQKVRIKQEVNVASQIQQSLLPPEEVQTPRYEIHSYYQSATETGGDYWGYFETERDVVIYIADATGHGLSSAMLTAAARGCFAAMHRLLVDYPELPALPSSLLTYANAAILDSAQDELNMTMFIASYSFRDGMLRYASAGHNPAWIIRQADDKKIEVLQSLGPRLGEREFESPLDQLVPFHENDILVLYTDGLLDGTNAEQAPYGKNRAKDLLLVAAAAGGSVGSIRSQLVSDFSTFTENKPLVDDISFTLFKLKTEVKNA
jgi:serine phosphatase RsbU (regulator of sigma subunit)